MIWYFIRKYVMIWVVLLIGLGGMAMVVAGMELSYLLPRAIFWCGLLAAIQLYFEFKRKDIWPLFDNLRISKGLLFGIAIPCSLLLSFVAAVLL